MVFSVGQMQYRHKKDAEQKNRNLFSINYKCKNCKDASLKLNIFNYRDRKKKQKQNNACTWFHIQISLNLSSENYINERKKEEDRKNTN